jgi:ribosome-associated protein
MIEVTPSIKLDESELQFDFVRASGPGGQNVNKVSTAVQLHFYVTGSPSLPQDIKDRLVRLAGSRMTTEGILVIEGKRYRTQEQNRLDVTRRLLEWIREAAEKPKVRRKTRPTLTSKAARLGDKKRRGAIKRIRKFNPDEWE